MHYSCTTLHVQCYAQQGSENSLSVHIRMHVRTYVLTKK